MTIWTDQTEAPQPTPAPAPLPACVRPDGIGGWAMLWPMFLGLGIGLFIAACVDEPHWSAWCVASGLCLFAALETWCQGQGD